MAEMMASWFVAMPACGLAALVAMSVVAVRGALGAGRAPLGTLVRVSGYALVLLAALVCCAQGLYEGDAPALAALVAIALVGAAISLARRQVRVVVARHVRARPRGLWWLLVASLLLAVAIAAVCALELPWNNWLFIANAPYQLFEVALLALAMTAAFFLARRRGIGMAALVVACFVVGLAQYFVVRFKDVAILPGDLFALGTAAAVSSGYTYAVGSSVALALVATCVGVTLSSVLAIVVGVLDDAPRGRFAPAAVDRLVSMSCLAALVALVVVPNFINDFGMRFDYWFTLDTYRSNGFLSSFIAAAQNIGIDAPDGYDVVTAERDEDELVAAYDKRAADDARNAATTQFESARPSVVVVMNETFSDLSASFDVLRDAGYEGPGRFNAIGDALMRGKLDVSVLGGGTCNTEFEFLTGFSYAFVGKGKYPYLMYDLAPFDNLARQLSGLGYRCSAMHPNLAANWARDRVYAAMGFDRFYDIDDFKGAERIHAGVSDAATYDKVIEILESDDRPQFVFDVTMQNHSGYDRHNMSADLQRHFGLEFYAEDQWTSNAIDEYLACIEASDRALDAFMARLAGLDRPVVLVFFGDHQPHFSAWINDDYYADAGELSHELRTHQTSYVIWANYDVGGRDQRSDEVETSADALGAMALDLVGAPLTRFQRARLAARAGVMSVSICGYEGADERWYAADADGPYRDVYDMIERINYYEFGSRV